MKKRFSKRVSAGLFLLGTLTGFAAQAQTSAEGWVGQKADQWYSDSSWRNGLPAKPSEVANKAEFAKQYHRNKAAWDKAFAFLKNTDFTRLRPGKYPIDDENVFAIISEGPPRDISSSKCEAHLSYNDIHYVVKGKEKIGITPVEKIKSNIAEAYNTDKDIAFYSTEGGNFYVAEPGNFFIITTHEAHNPGNKVEGYEGVKKVVVKVKNIR